MGGGGEKGDVCKVLVVKGRGWRVGLRAGLFGGCVAHGGLRENGAAYSMRVVSGWCSLSA